ncbi:MAG: type II restriction endonuclease [Planctomycetota bacterium]|nr:type II restriction endonuclease [Planctomycetota bacterium]
MRLLTVASPLASSLAKPIGLAFLIHLLASIGIAQESQSQKDRSPKSREEEVRLGSQTATGGFQNEDEIRDKFNNWQKDSDARSWLEAMNFRISDIQQVRAAKPHGEKADVEVRVKTNSSERVEGISIKLVSNPQGFNQIDKRWLKTYAQMWNMPSDVHSALKLFVGEIAPTEPGRDSRRMFLNELSKSQHQAVVDFFRENREKIVSDLFQGDGEHAAGWFMVTLKSSDNAPASSKKIELNPRWMLCSTKEAVAFFGSGEVQITPSGSLRIGRITMQRKGGDNGRESANMLQFKINPTELFEMRK